MKKHRRWRIVQKGKTINGAYCAGTLIGPTKCSSDKLYINASGKWIEWNIKVHVVHCSDEGLTCSLIPPGTRYKIIGLRDEDFNCGDQIDLLDLNAKYMPEPYILKVLIYGKYKGKIHQCTCEVSLLSMEYSYFKDYFWQKIMAMEKELELKGVDLSKFKYKAYAL